MQKISLIFLIFLSTVLAQSLSEINKEIDQLRNELTSPNPSNSVQLEDYSAIVIDTPEESIIDNMNFGYSYFKRDINFFDNIPTPSNYRFGAGDELILSLWGENNFRRKFVVNRNGLIYFENIGFINIQNKTIEETENLLTKELSKIYETLNDEINSTKLMVELGRLKSINVYFTGLIEKPGIHLIHPFSDIFTAIVQAGGVREDGSLRNIQLIRDGEVISKIDFYEFFLSGKNEFTDLKIIDGDVIHIPALKNRVRIRGEVNRPGSFEVFNDEKISNLIDYASGFTTYASTSMVIDTIDPFDIRKSNDKALSSINIDFNKNNDFRLSKVSRVNVLRVADVDSKVQVYGRVKNPGKFSANSTLKEVLDIAGGFNDPIFSQSIKKDEIIILRQTSEQYYGLEFKESYSSSSNFELEPNDKIFVYEDINYKNSFTYTIRGQVNKPGTYPLKKGYTIEDAISYAGGLTEFGSINSISVLKNFNKFGQALLEENLVGNISLDMTIDNGMVIEILPIENTIKVEGNIYQPGLVAITKNFITVSKAIQLAGGFKPDTMKNRIYIIRSNGKVETVGILRGKSQKRVFPGDRLIAPLNPKPQDFDITAFVADLSSTLANIAAILLIVNNNQ